jgi:predicted signal transduction protein with EAL and GGDEF domain
MQLLKRRLLRAEARQRVMAQRDPLTALYNRRTFDATLERAVGRRDGVALVLFDFDAFKAINDEYGHPVGIPAVRASFAWAVAPADAQSAQALLDCADQRLLYRKRLNKQAI